MENPEIKGPGNKGKFLWKRVIKPCHIASGSYLRLGSQIMKLRYFLNQD